MTDERGTLPAETGRKFAGQCQNPKHLTWPAHSLRESCAAPPVSPPQCPKCGAVIREVGHEGPNKFSTCDSCTDDGRSEFHKVAERLGLNIEQYEDGTYMTTGADDGWQLWKVAVSWARGER